MHFVFRQHREAILNYGEVVGYKEVGLLKQCPRKVGVEDALSLSHTHTHTRRAWQAETMFFTMAWLDSEEDISTQWLNTLHTPFKYNANCALCRRCAASHSLLEPLAGGQPRATSS